MNRIIGAILAGLLALQGGLVALDLSDAARASSTVAVSVLIAALSYYLGVKPAE